MKVLFLDIDGILQPCGCQERFSHKDEIPSQTVERIILSSGWQLIQIDKRNLFFWMKACIHRN